MIKLLRGNAILRVEDDAPIDKYLARGYSVVDNNNKIIQASVPTDGEELRTIVVTLQTQLDESREQINKLEAEVKRLKAEKKKKN